VGSANTHDHLLTNGAVSIGVTTAAESLPAATADRRELRLRSDAKTVEEQCPLRPYNPSIGRAASLLVVTFVLGLLGGGCERGTSRARKPTAPTTPSRVIRRLDADVKTLNYLLQTSEEERQVLAYLNDPLIALDQNLEPVAGIAERWEIGDSGRAYTLHLDPRATFSDGTPVTANDVRFTLLKALDTPSPQFSGWFEHLDRVKTQVVDARTIRVVFTTARAAQLLAFNIGVLPEHVYGVGDFTSIAAVVGSGPYVVTRREQGQNILLKRRADYWREQPKIESVLFRVIAEEQVAWNALLRGELDVSRVSNDIWWREKDRPEVRAKLRFIDTWLLSYNCFAWNLDDPLFRDARVRRALALSFDRPSVIGTLLHGQARPVTGPFTPDQWANNPAVPPLPFDLRQAAALLAAAGWRDTDRDGTLDRAGRPFVFTMLIPVGTVARDQTQVFQAALRTVGIRMEIETMDGAAFYDRVLKRNFQSAFFSWFNEPDPDPYSLFHTGQKAPAGLNVGAYSNAEADRLMERGRVEFDRARRTATYHQLHALLARDQPYLWTVQVATKWAVNRRLENVQSANGLGLFLWYPGPYTWRLTEKKNT
jgi:peptide/nickel transport system substrate-binding protein